MKNAEKRLRRVSRRKTRAVAAFALICAAAVAATMLAVSPAAAVQVKMRTSMGEILIAVDEVNAPVTAANFLKYVQDGFFDGTIFHRIISGFVIQGGGFTPDMKQKRTRRPIINEAANGLKNKKYTLSMARTSDPASATSQFFINVADNAFLDHTAPTRSGYGYAVFAEVVEGKDVVDAIAEVKTGNFEGYQNVPETPVIIEKAEVVK